MIKKEHWISLFINLSGKTLQDKPGIFYFDSYGHKPPSQVKDFIDSAEHKCVITYFKHSQLFKIYKDYNMTMIDQYGRETDDKKKCTEVIIANF